MHLRGFQFRENPECDEWKVFDFNCVQFGDCPATSLMTIAVQRATETYKEVARDLNFPTFKVKEDSKKLLLDIYVDDDTTSGSRKEVNRMIRDKLSDASFSGKNPKYEGKSRTPAENYCHLQFIRSRIPL